MSRSNLPRLIEAAKAIKPLLPRLVFVGGSVVEIYFTESIHEVIRETVDVDCVVNVTTRQDFFGVEASLRELGFGQPGHEGDPICRWRKGSVVLDIIPVDQGVLGFGNPWYEHAFASPLKIPLEEGLDIAIPSPPVFMATKLEAFLGRGKGDLLSSHDFEDLIALIDGRPELADEMRQVEGELRSFLVKGLQSLLSAPGLENVLSGFFPHQGPGRAEVLLQRLKHLVR